MSDRPHRVVLAPAAQRELRRLPPGDAARLRAPILAFAIDPHPPGVAKLADTGFWRLRVADLRIVYDIDADSTVVVLRVARRSESTYRHRASYAGVLRDVFEDPETYLEGERATWERGG